MFYSKPCTTESKPLCGQNGSLISIIVPVYQVSQYIGECVDSLIGQTYTNLEIILVDDGSTDGSGEICDEYARRDERIKVIHQANAGLSAARNMGLDHAEGEYIAFVDSDDIVLPFYIEELYHLIGKYHADIAACAFVKCRAEQMEWIRSEIVADNGTSVGNRRGSGEHDNIGETHHAAIEDDIKEICMSSEEMLRQWHGKYKQYETIACNKLYNRNAWNGRNRKRFPEGRNHEDVLTSHIIVQSVGKVALTTRKLYLYRVREGSIITRVGCTREGIRQNLSAQKERMSFFRKQRYWRAYVNLLKGYLLHVVWFGWKGIVWKIRTKISPL